MTAKRKDHFIKIHITAPKDMTAAEVRREVRTLIRDQCNYSADPDDLKVRSVKKIKPGRVDIGYY